MNIVMIITASYMYYALNGNHARPRPLDVE